MSTREELAREVVRLARIGESANARYSAHLMLHTLAARSQDAGDMVQRRDELHTILDVVLDNSESIERANNQLLSLTTR